MILNIKETEEGISLTQEDGNDRVFYEVDNKFELVYRVVELVFKWLSTESVKTPKG